MCSIPGVDARSFTWASTSRRAASTSTPLVASRTVNSAVRRSL
jgi:hypothetical protein